MKTLKLFFLLAVLSISFSCKSEKAKQKEVKTITVKEAVDSLKKDDLKILNFEALKPYLEKNDDKIHVINFWATWCKPCVEELPAFEKIHSEYKDSNVEVLLVSLDFPNEIQTELIPFINERNLQPEVVVLDDPDQNKWINGIESTWSGAIPATIIYNKKNRLFFEQSFTYEELQSELQNFLN